jgi:hypothetical protein
MLVHRLVAEAFLGVEDAVVNHKDGDKRHNSDTNLEWCSQGANVEHYWKMRERKEDRQRIRAQQDEPINF